jgi:hypothetical protein
MAMRYVGTLFSLNAASILPHGTVLNVLATSRDTSAHSFLLYSCTFDDFSYVFDGDCSESSFDDSKLFL